MSLFFLMYPYHYAKKKKKIVKRKIKDGDICTKK